MGESLVRFNHIPIDLPKADHCGGARSEILNNFLHRAMKNANAQMGNIQLLDPSGDLRIEVHSGLTPHFVAFFDRVCRGQAACGTALERGRPVIVENVSESVGIYDSESKHAMLSAGAHAVQSVPLKGAEGTIIGVLSVLYAEVLQIQNILYIPCPKCGESNQPVTCDYCGGGGFVEVLRDF